MQSEKYSKTWSKPPWKNGAQDERKVRILGQHYALGHQVRVELTTPPTSAVSSWPTCSPSKIRLRMYEQDYCLKKGTWVNAVFSVSHKHSSPPAPKFLDPLHGLDGIIRGRERQQHLFHGKLFMCLDVVVLTNSCSTPTPLGTSRSEVLFLLLQEN